MIILAATGALFWWASAMTAGTTDDLATRDLGRLAADIQSSALECDVGPVDYSVLGENLTFSGSVHDCLRTILLARAEDVSCDVDGLVDAVLGIYGLLVEKTYYYCLRAEVKGLGPDLYISENGTEPGNPGAVRWTSAVPLIVNGMEGELTLYLWR